MEFALSGGDVARGLDMTIAFGTGWWVRKENAGTWSLAFLFFAGSSFIFYTISAGVGFGLPATIAFGIGWWAHKVNAGTWSFSFLAGAALIVSTASCAVVKNFFTGRLGG